MMCCAICHVPLEKNDRVVFNRHETFICKPAHVQDEPGINPALLTPDELAESRKDHKRTALATVYASYGIDPLPESVINVRHVYCGVQKTGESHSGAHPVTKHAVRYSRMMPRRMNG